MWPPNIPLQQAIQYHRAGDLTTAERLYRQLLQAEPKHADAWHLLGVAAWQSGRHDEALASIRQAIALNSTVADYHSNLGLVHQSLGQWDEAIACGREAVRLRPAFAEAHLNLGHALTNRRRYAEAIASCSEAARLRPDLPEAHNNLGNALRQAGRLSEAIASFETALRLRPEFPEAWNNLGVAQAKLGQVPAAIAAWQAAIRLRPSYAEAHDNLGQLLKEAGQLDEAIRCFRQALAVRPDYAEAHLNLGLSLAEQGRHDEALSCYDAALQVRPDLAQAHVKRGHVHLLSGDFAQGWREHEWRLRCDDFEARDFAQPRWNGESLAGRTILLHAEQGLGDTIQFIRYAPLVSLRGGQVIVECQRPLAKLLAGFEGVDQLVPRGEPLPEFAVQAPLLSLPHLFGTTLHTIPAAVPYLRAEPQRIERWRQRIGESPGFRIGIAWQGNPAYRLDKLRSIRLARFAPLAAVPGVRLISLQKNLGSEQIAELRDQFTVEDFSAELDLEGAFLDTAALMTALDLVVTSDTSLAHLAGALGVPTWVALPVDPDWRWLLAREDSPWYPSMRLFRQTERGNWSEVFGRIAAEVARQVN
ncbi:MAG: tetratricopeptide repeat protein [Pirellulaceae bacterium]|nr:tetratricopeptide repeat protein [Pirellulaceae bacterium]